MKLADQRCGMCFGAVMMRGNRWSAAVAACFLAGCGGNGAGSSGDAGSGAAMSGLYAQTEGEHRGQLCLVEREGRAGSFGFITWGRNDANCSGSGSVRREGDRLTLLLDGDESCAIEAQFENSIVKVTRSLSGDCARYYCAGGASLDGAQFLRAELGNEAAAKARDLAGDPLCGDTGNN